MPLVYMMLFIATIPLANWMIGHVGTCFPSGPCVIPVGFGLEAPSGVLVIGLALVLRDLVHSTGGMARAWICIVLGSFLSFAIAPPVLAFASGVAFAISEAADLFVYAPLRERRLVVAVLASGLVGAIVDSAAFLLLAFGSLNYLEGQVVGKIWATLAAAAALWAMAHRRVPA